MGSPIADMIYQNTGIDLVYIILFLAVLVLILFILNARSAGKVKRLTQTMDRFTRGKDAESMEETILEALDKIEDIELLLNAARKEVAGIQKRQKHSYQKLGLVKYNAFFDLSGELSCAICLLDQEDNGFILNSVYSREGGYSYVKEIRKGQCGIELGKEEQEALEQAKNQA